MGNHVKEPCIHLCRLLARKFGLSGGVDELGEELGAKGVKKAGAVCAHILYSHNVPTRVEM